MTTLGWIICSGGQSGVDRAALDVAREMGLTIEGWCPSAGWAEDYEEPPGLLKQYPELRETPSTDPRQRTAWNVRDSDATLILLPGIPLSESPGTAFTAMCAHLLFTKPLHVADLTDDQGEAEVRTWLRRLRDGRRDPTLNVAGPRESTRPGVYRRARAFLAEVLRPNGDQQ